MLLQLAQKPARLRHGNAEHARAPAQRPRLHQGEKEFNGVEGERGGHGESIPDG